MKTLCANCGTPISRTPDHRSKTKNVFCNKSCAATINNRTAIKRKAKRHCDKCNKTIRSNTMSSMCGNCYKKKVYLDDKTLSEAIQNRTDANRYTGIRGNASKAYNRSGKPRVCFVCGYELHVEICHIKDIADFPLDTLIREINNINNLIALCPNHHWEFDHDLITIDPAGIEPATKGLIAR